MAAVLTLIAWLILLPILPPMLVFLTEVILGQREPNGGSQDRPGSFVVLMPAHDEAAGIGATIAALQPGLPAGGRILVVADNCADDTAAVAHAGGAEVIERNDPLRRGKGFALAFGREWLRARPPESVIVLDADCRFAAGAAGAAALAAAAIRSGRPVQGRYLFIGDATQPPMVQASSFALLVKNRVRQRGLGRLGAPALLGGTGMAFPWAIFETAPLATDDLVEDLALGLAVAEAGQSARYRDDIVILSAPSSAAGTLAQRTRWEHGFLDTARRHGMRLVRTGLLRSRPELAWAGFHLITPPLALLVALAGAVGVGDLMLALAGASAAPFVLALVLILMLGGAVLISWWRFGRETLAAGTLLKLPLYVLWKLPLYLRFLGRRERTWVRTERPPPTDAVH